MPESPKALRVEVECYAGYRGEETPRRIRLGDTTLEVENILDRWLAPHHRYFKVRASDGDTYILRHDGISDEWEIVFFRSERPD